MGILQSAKSFRLSLRLDESAIYASKNAMYVLPNFLKRPLAVASK